MNDGSEWYSNPEWLVTELRETQTHWGQLPDIPGCDQVMEISRGGQGVVYRARQISTNRVVAVKVLLGGRFAADIDRFRFQREIEFVARLRHPYIVRVYDSGVTTEGFPYYVMEYVEGLPVDAQDLEHAGDLEKTLILFTKICDAVQHAHQHGIIHRDLKPGNILIDSGGSPHILDFGIAKIVADASGDDRDLTTMSRTGQFLGSLAWASPEQIEDSPEQIDLRADVYSLGVILYQLVTGRLPHEISKNLRQTLNEISTHDPPRPRTLRRDIPGDVETMLLKCLAKAPERRYQTVGELGRDIQHYLKGEPIDAKRDHTWYVLRKTFARHKAVTVLAALLLILILGFAITMSILYRRASKAEISALENLKMSELQTAKANSVKEFLQEMLASFDPLTSPDTSRAVRQMLDEAALKLDDRFEAHPKIEAEIRCIMGGAYYHLGRLDEAEENTRRAKNLWESIYNDAYPEAGQVLCNLGNLMIDRYRFDDAEALLQQALDKSKGQSEEERIRTADCLVNFAELRTAQFRFEEAKTLYDRASEIYREFLSPEERRRLAAEMQWASLLITLGKLDEAEEKLGYVLQIIDRHPKESAWARSPVHLYLGKLKIEANDCESAEKALLEAIRSEREVFGESHPRMAEIFEQMGNLRRIQHWLADAEEWYRKSLAVREAIRGHESAEVASSLWNIAQTKLLKGELDDAEPIFLEALAIRRKVYEPDHHLLWASLSVIGFFLRSSGRWDEALPYFEEVAQIQSSALGGEHVLTLRANALLGECLVELGRYEEGESLLLQAYTGLCDQENVNPGHVTHALSSLARLYAAWGKPEAAKKHRTLLSGLLSEQNEETLKSRN